MADASTTVPETATGPSRRSVLGAGVVAVPVVSMMTSLPAHAAASNQETVTVSTGSGFVPAAGSVAVTATVTSPTGSSFAGRSVSFLGPSGSSFADDDGVTNGSGSFSTTFTYGKPWATPGSTAVVSAVSGSSSGSGSFTVLGANAYRVGSGGGRPTVSGPTQEDTVFPSPIVAFSMGMDNAAALLADGTVWTTGANTAQLGDGSSTGRSTWAKVPTLSGVTSICVSNYHCAAVTSNGDVYTWGGNSGGELGLGHTTTMTVPTKVTGLTGAKQVTTGRLVTFVLKKDGTVWSTGANTNFQLGSTGADRSTFAQISGLGSVTQVSGGFLLGGLALKSDGTVWAWGINGQGQLCDGTTTNSATPKQIPGLTNVKKVQGSSGSGYGASSGFALKTDNTLWAWGYNGQGQLGDGTKVNRSTPYKFGDNFADVAASTQATYALKTDGVTLSATGRTKIDAVGDVTTPGTITLPRPVVAMSEQTFAAYDHQRAFLITADARVSVDVVEAQVAAGVAGTVKAKVAAGAAGVGGAAVALSATSNAVLGAASGLTDSSGAFQTTVTADTWTMPGTVVRVTASSDANDASDSFTVWGANAVGFGDNLHGQFGDDTARPTAAQLPRVFPAPVKHGVISEHGSAGVLLTDGTVWTAGNGADGTLGDGITNAGHGRRTWAKVAGLPTIVQLATSWGAMYALTSTGSVYAWGTNFNGQLGYVGSPNGSPQLLPGISDARQIACSGSAVHAVTSTGSVVSLGENKYGQFGVGNLNHSASPVVMPGVSGAVQIAASDGAVYVLRSDGTVVSTGRGSSGDAAQGVGANTLTPKVITGLSGVKAVASFNQGGYALMNDGTVRGWGLNDSGAVGNGTTSAGVGSPVTVTGVSNAVQIAGNYFSGYALLADGSLKAWGRNASGELGDGTTTNRPTPITVNAGSRPIVALPGHGVGGLTTFLTTGDVLLAVDVTASPVTAGSTAVVKTKASAGTVGVPGTTISLSATPGVTLGATTGQTDSSGTFQTTATPDAWTTPGSVARVTAASGPSTGTGTFSVLGANLAGAGVVFTGGLAPMAQAPRVFPSPVVQIASACGDSSGDTWWIALLKDGSVWTSGLDDSFGHLAGGGPGDGSAKWAKVPSLSGVTQVAAMYASGFALLSSGKVMAWGANWRGQLGIGSTNVPSAPVQIAGLSGVTQIAVGDRTGYALLSDGSVKAWGQNNGGETGSGSSTDPQLNPVTVTGLSNVTQIAATGHTGLALLSDGTVKSWGYNSPTPASGDSGSGLVGDGTSVNRTTPVSVTGLSGVTQIAGGGYAAYALLSDKTVKAWGTNGAGSIGDGTTTDRTTPVTVSGLSNVVQVSGVQSNGYALLADGSVKGWGDNSWGQLCDGTITNRPAPVTVQLPQGRRVAKLPSASPRGKWSSFFLLERA